MDQKMAFEWVNKIVDHFKESDVDPAVEHENKQRGTLFACYWNAVDTTKSKHIQQFFSTFVFSSDLTQTFILTSSLYRLIVPFAIKSKRLDYLIPTFHLGCLLNETNELPLLAKSIQEHTQSSEVTFQLFEQDKFTKTIQDFEKKYIHGILLRLSMSYSVFRYFCIKTNIVIPKSIK